MDFTDFLLAMEKLTNFKPTEWSMIMSDLEQRTVHMTGILSGTPATVIYDLIKNVTPKIKDLKIQHAQSRNAARVTAKILVDTTANKNQLITAGKFCLNGRMLFLTEKIPQSKTTWTLSELPRAITEFDLYCSLSARDKKLVRSITHDDWLYTIN